MRAIGESNVFFYLFIYLPIQQPHNKRIVSQYGKNKQTKQLTSWLVAY